MNFLMHLRGDSSRLKKIVVAFVEVLTTLSLLATIANTKDKSKYSLHINHKKSKNSDLWEMHCKDFVTQENQFYL